jgi:hypothetical protein
MPLEWHHMGWIQRPAGAGKIPVPLRYFRIPVPLKLIVAVINSFL